MSTVDLGTGQEELFSNEECEFAYRTSVFKTERQQKCLIKGVTLILKREASPNITYSGLSAKLQNGKVWSNKEWLVCQQLAVFWFLCVKQTDKFVTISEHIQANLSQFAGFRKSASFNGSTVGGSPKNPYDTTRSPAGSSSGSGVATATVSYTHLTLPTKRIV